MHINPNELSKHRKALINYSSNIDLPFSLRIGFLYPIRNEKYVSITKHVSFGAAQLDLLLSSSSQHLPISI